MTVTDEMVALLPFQFNKAKSGNIYKLLDLFGQQLDKIRSSTYLIGAYKNIEEASGKALEMIGIEYGVARSTADDSLYRFLIKSHIEMSLHVGTLNEIIQSFSQSSGLPLYAFDVKNGNEVMSVQVNNIPSSLTPNQEQHNLVENWINSILPAGIRLEAISFREASASEIAMGIVVEQSAWFSSPVSHMSF